MAVQKANLNDIPEGSVRLSENEVLQYHIKLIKEWKPMKDVWPFYAGEAIVSTTAAITGTCFNIYYRKKLLIGHLARASTFLPIAVIPAISSLVVHQVFVTPDILKFKSVCPLCVELRAAGIQVALGTLFPLILAPLACFSVAVRKYTYDVPSIIHEPKEVFKLWQKITAPKTNMFLGFALANAAMAAFLTHMKAKSLYNIQMKLLQASED